MAGNNQTGMPDNHEEWFDQMGEVPPSTLGQMIDGFSTMSVPDRELFFLVLEKQGHLKSLGFQRIGKTSHAAVVAAPSVGKSDGQQSGTVRNVFVPQPLPPQPIPVVQTVGVNPTTPGTTTDPKTGKVYRLQMKTNRSQDFVNLSNRAEEARRVLGQYMTNHGYVHDVAAKVTRRRSDQTVVDNDDRLNQLVEGVKTAHEAVTAYKKRHPEEFRATQAKARKSVVPTINLRTASPVRSAGSVNVPNQGTSGTGNRQSSGKTSAPNTGTSDLPKAM